MKKLLNLVMILMLTLTLSGCEEDNGYPYGGGTTAIQDQLNDMQNSFYTQEEVDEMLEGLQNNMCILEFAVYESVVVEKFEDDLVLAKYKNHYNSPLRTTIAYGYEVGDTIYIAVYEETDIAIEWWKVVENCEVIE